MKCKCDRVSLEIPISNMQIVGAEITCSKCGALIKFYDREKLSNIILNYFFKHDDDYKIT